MVWYVEVIQGDGDAVGCMPGLHDMLRVTGTFAPVNVNQNKIYYLASRHVYTYTFDFFERNTLLIKLQSPATNNSLPGAKVLSNAVSSLKYLMTNHSAFNAQLDIFFFHQVVMLTCNRRWISHPERNTGRNLT